VRVVLDTNVLVSAVLGGRSRKVLDLWLEQQFELLLTSEILEEYLELSSVPNSNPIVTVQQFPAQFS
jgi:predicted nucleic acid-binding protein